MMSMVRTYWAEVCVGQRVGYTEELIPSDVYYNICEEYCNKVGLCVTITPTMFVYKNGAEPGFIIRLINYPRFPEEPHALLEKAQNLAIKLKEVAKQKRVSIITPLDTILIGEKD